MIQKLLPHRVEKPKFEDRTGPRCFDGGGPPYRYEGEDRRALCILPAGHKGLHYCFQGENPLERIWWAWS